MLKKQLNTNKYVAFGFSLVIVLMITIISLWKYNDFVRGQQFKQNEQHQFEFRAISKVLHDAHLRAITLYKMTTMQDPFERDDAYLEFQQYGENLMKQRDLLVTLNAEKEEETIWSEIRPILNEGYNAQYKVIELINDGKVDEASRMIATKVSPIQDHLQKKMAKLLAIKQEQLKRERAEAKKLDSTINIYISLLALVCIILALLTILVTRRTAKVDADLASQAYKIRALYEVASQPHESLNEKIDDTLKVGCELFNLEIGKLCKIDAGKETNKMSNVVVPKNFQTILQKNMEVPLVKTFCSIPYSEEKIVLLHNIATSDYKTYPCYEFANLGAYIAAPINVHGKKYGTINFSSFKARNHPYTEADHDLLYLIGKFVSVIIEAELSKDMIIDKKASDNANAAKSRFLSNMSHEIRTPLNAIIGYSELILSEELVSDETAVEDIKRINKAGHHLLHVVNNVLDISKVEAGKMTVEPEPFNLDSLLDTVSDIIKPLIHGNNNTFNIQNYAGGVELFTDMQKLKQILLNLLSNASKFTTGGEITLTCEKSFRPGGEVLSISVKDTGIGMCEEAQQSIFEEYTQDKSINHSRYAGTGLGLNICKTFSVMMGGDISVTCVQGEGCEFRVSIPLRYIGDEYATVSGIQ